VKRLRNNPVRTSARLFAQIAVPTATITALNLSTPERALIVF